MTVSISDATYSLVKELYPNTFKSKQAVLNRFSDKDLDTSESVMVPVPVSFDSRQSEIMVRYNDANRKVSAISMEQFRLAFEAKTFYRTGDCFMVTTNGCVVNGGCRNTSYLTHQKTKGARLPGYLLLEVSQEAVLVTDQARKRNVAAQLKLAFGYEVDSIMSNVIKTAWYANNTYSSLSRVNLGMPEYETYTRENIDSIREFSAEIRQYNGRTGLDKQPVHRALYVVYMHSSGEGSEFIRDFFTDNGYGDLRDDVMDGTLKANPLMNIILMNAYAQITGKSGDKKRAIEFFSE